MNDVVLMIDTVVSLDGYKPWTKTKCEKNTNNNGKLRSKTLRLWVGTSPPFLPGDSDHDTSVTLSLGVLLRC